MAVLSIAGVASAQTPILQGVSQQNRHVSITFSTPGASDVFVNVASAADQGSDGSFYSENIVDSAVLTDTEIASGSWLDSNQLPPGEYWVSIDATPDYTTCLLDDGTVSPSCSNGYSNVESVTIPRPNPRYRASESEMFANIGIVYLKLTATPLGANQTVRLCYSTKRGNRATKHCLSRNLDGYDWNSSASDLARLSTRGMSSRERFTWSLSGRTVARLTVKIPKEAR